MKFLTHLDLQRNQLVNARIEQLAAAPTSPVTGMLYHNTTDGRTYVYTGAAWTDVTVARGGTLDAVTLTGSPIIKTATTKALGSGTTSAFRVRSSDNHDLFQVMDNGDTVIAGVLKVLGTGESEFAGNVKIGGNLTVEGDATVKGLFQGDTFNLTGNLNVAGSTTLGDDSTLDTTTIKGYTKVISKVNKATGSASAAAFEVQSKDNLALFQVMENGDAKIAGVLTVSSVNSGGSGSPGASFTGDTTVENLIVNQNLTVKGITKLGDNAVADSTEIKGLTTVHSKSTKAAGSASVPAFRIMDASATPEALFQVMENGDTVIAGVLKVKGTGESEFAGNVKIGGNLTVEGDATVKGVMTGNNFNIQGNLIVDGNTTLGNNAAEDSTTINGYTLIKTAGLKSAANAATTSVFKIQDSSAAALFDVKQNGDTVIGGTLTVSGGISGATTSKDLTVDGNLTVNGNTTLGDAAGDTITVTGAARFAQNIDMNNKQINNLSAPVNANDAATKAYVDAVKTGLDPKDSVRAATTANITLTGAQTIDGVALITGDRVLVKNQTTAAQNGIYVVAAGAWTRAADCDNVGGTEVTSGLFTFVEEGTSNATSGWVLATSGTITVGTTALNFVQFSGAGQIDAGNGLTKSGNQINAVGTANRITVNTDSIDIASNYVGQSSITTLGTITTGTWNGTTIAVANGGTGATSAVGARTNLGATGKAAGDIGGATSVNFTHGLNSLDVVVSVRDKATNDEVMCEIKRTDVNTVTLGFAAAPAAGAYRVVVVG